MLCLEASHNLQFPIESSCFGIEKAMRWISTALCCLALAGCGDDASQANGAGSGQQHAGDAGSAAGLDAGPTHVSEGGTRVPGSTPDAARADASDEEPCVAVSTQVELEPVYLAVAFDVSGSMGKGDKPWHDKELKWDPVVSATRSFFEAAESSALSASLTFFPEDGGLQARCDDAAYAEPDVPMTRLPSPRFGEAIDVITPASDGDWRGGTPTVHVVRGTTTYLQGFRTSHQGRIAIVLITDGYPEGCGGEADRVEAVVEAIEAARDIGIDTYVIGVANPDIQGAPENVEDLHAIAVAGGTGQAFLIDTGDPQATADRFADAVDAIRATAVSCEISIPDPPDGTSFDKEKVAVRYGSASASARMLEYDASCTSELAWHYDDPADPSRILLCDNTCSTVQADPEASLDVGFTCEPTIVLK